MLITARLTNTVTGQVVKAAGFQYNAPVGVLGASLTIALTDALTGGAPIGDALKFEVGVGSMASLPPVWSWVTLMDAGRIAGSASHTTFLPGVPKGRPGDTLEISALNTLADRWTLAPESPVIMVNPQIVPPASLQVSPQDAPKDLLTGEAILPVIESFDNLNLYQVLTRAYTGRGGTGGAGCGFSDFVTNLPNYPVERADFSLQSGWHGGASPLYSMFNPIFYEYNNILYIWDIDKGLPSGYVPHSLALKCVVTLDVGTPPEEITNAILLSYRLPQATGTDNTVIFPGGIPNAIPGYRFEHETPLEGGQPNQPGYYRQEITRKILEYKDLTTGEVVFSAEVEAETTDFAFNLTQNRDIVVSRQTLQVFYQGKLKTGHLLRMEANYPNPTVQGNPPLFQDILTESCQMEWTADLNNPGESILKRSVTETEGVVLVEEELELREGETEPRRQYTPILEAARGNGVILDVDKQEEAGVRQYTQRRPIKAIFENLRTTGYNQAQRVTSQVDLLKGQAYPPIVTSGTGALSTGLGGRSRASRSTAQNARTELIKDLDSIARYGFRRALDLDAGALPQAEARALASRTLYRKAHPRRAVTIELPGVDLSIRRGSIVKAVNRSGGFVVAIITGFTITGRALGIRGQQNINMILEGIEVL